MELIGHTLPLPASLTDPENAESLKAHRLPYVDVGRTTVLVEPGRIKQEREFKVCMRAFSYALSVHGLHSQFYCLHAKNGRGQFDVRLDRCPSDAIVAILALPSDARYLVLHTLWQTHEDGITEGRAKVMSHFLAGRLKKRTRKVCGKSFTEAYLLPKNELAA